MKAISLTLAIALVLIVPVAAGRGASEAVPGSGTIEYAFTPEGDAAALVIRALGSAREAVYVQAFSFTHKDIAQALIDAQRRGVEVEVIADASQIELIAHNVVPMLAAAGVPVLVDDRHVSAHDKVMIIDPDTERPAVVTGSFNFTFAAQYRNAENLLILRGNRELARAYLENWRRHRSHASSYRSR